MGLFSGSTSASYIPSIMVSTQPPRHMYIHKLMTIPQKLFKDGIIQAKKRRKNYTDKINFIILVELFLSLPGIMALKNTPAVGEVIQITKKEMTTVFLSMPTFVSM